MIFHKYQALGNDYLVIEPGELPAPLTPAQARWLCDRHYGIGADGVLFGPLPSGQADYRLRIFNPDGSEAEKSGNGLRIFARYLFDQGMSSTSASAVIETPGGIVSTQVLESGKRVRVEMGQASFDSQLIPVSGPPRQVLQEPIDIAGREYLYCGVTLGNPHCVILCDEISPELAESAGPLLENDPRFPNRTNVQFVKVLDRQNIQIEIWERGAGYTLASGSSSCAAAASACCLKLCDSPVTVHMPGGELLVEIAADYSLTLTGAVEKVFEGILPAGIPD